MPLPVGAWSGHVDCGKIEDMIQRLKNKLIRIQHENPLEGRNVVVKAEGNQFEKHVLIVGNLVIRQFGRVVWNDGRILRREGCEILGLQVGSHEDDDAMGCVKNSVETMNVDQNRAGVVGFCRVKNVGKGR